MRIYPKNRKICVFESKSNVLDPSVNRYRYNGQTLTRSKSSNRSYGRPKGSKLMMSDDREMLDDHEVDDVDDEEEEEEEDEDLDENEDVEDVLDEVAMGLSDIEKNGGGGHIDLEVDSGADDIPRHGSFFSNSPKLSA